MKIFVCEFITGGGLYREALPASLALEGELMRDALLGDLGEIAHVQVLTTYDARLAIPSKAYKAMAISQTDDVWQTWYDCIVESDAVWIIAPETNGILTKLTEMVEQQHKKLLGCGLDSIKVAARKYATYQAFTAANIPTIPTYKFSEFKDQPLSQCDGWVAKLDDGAGCEDSAYFKDGLKLIDWIETGKRTHSHIVQPYQTGTAASISMLCNDGKAWLLSCNSQKIDLDTKDDAAPFSYAGSTINGMAKYWQAFDAIAQQVAAALPTLAGYVGIDLIVTMSGKDTKDPAIYVLEINPRLTTSYVGLREATGTNPAALILQLFGADLDYNQSFTQPFSLPAISRNIVDISLHV
ncbi:MAG: ATP-grasp domain-containing protein [Methylophilaceae bacterium]|nr:ATP-grasp domain-containing protein [Methyloradius sp.]